MKKRSDGFTLVEVMVAVGLMVVGSLGILAMQDASTRANRSSRRMHIGNVITQTWIDRLHRDSLAWTTEGVASASFATTKNLSMLSQDTTATGWARPVATRTGESALADWYGIDTLEKTETSYCTHIALTWLRQGRSIRADVRTMWIRDGVSDSSDAVPGSRFADTNCENGQEDDFDPEDVPNVRVVYGSTVLRWNPR